MGEEKVTKAKRKVFSFKIEEREKNVKAETKLIKYYTDTFTYNVLYLLSVTGYSSFNTHSYEAIVEYIYKRHV